MNKKTLKDIMPSALVGCEYDKTKAYDMKDEIVVEKHGDMVDENPAPWPGKHKNVYLWVELENGYAVGWNENPSRGWSFPVHKMEKNVWK